MRTQNATLVVGANTEVEVTASNSEVTIDTNDATIGNTFDANKLNDLPVQQRNDPTALFTMQPGVTDKAQPPAPAPIRIRSRSTAWTSSTSPPAAPCRITPESRRDSGIVGHAPIDSVQEFHATVGGFGADSGPGSGGQFQLVTKSGTNQWHGNVNEYHRDPSLVANGWFANNATPIVPRNHLIQNQFGGNVGGPDPQEQALLLLQLPQLPHHPSQLTFRTVPLDSLRAGNINYINSQRRLTPPDSRHRSRPLTPPASANLRPFSPPSIPASRTRMRLGGDGINSGGYNFNAPDNDIQTNYVGRVDYNINANMKISRASPYPARMPPRP